MTISIRIKLDHLSEITDCVINHELDSLLPLLVVHNLKFFGFFNLKVLNLVLLWRTGSNYGLPSSQRKLYLSDINHIKGYKFVSMISSYKKTKACEFVLALKGKTSALGLKWSLLNDGEEGFEMIEDNLAPEKEEINFCDKFGVIKYGLWKKERKKCLEKGLKLEPSKTTISVKSNEHLKEESTDPIRKLIDIIPDVMVMNQIKRYKDKLESRGARISVEEERRKARAKEYKLEIEKLEGKLAKERKELDDFNIKRLALESKMAGQKVRFAPSGCEKKRKSYFRAFEEGRFLYKDEWKSTFEQSMKSVLELARFFPADLGWKSDIDDFLIPGEYSSTFRVIDPNKDKEDTVYNSRPNLKVEDVSLRIELEAVKSEISNAQSSIGTLTSSLNINKAWYERMSEKYVHGWSSGGEEEIERLENKLRVKKADDEMKMKPIPGKSIKAPLVHSINDPKGVSERGFVLKFDEFRKAKKGFKFKQRESDKGKSIEVSNMYSCLEYDDNDFIADVSKIVESGVNMIDLFKNRPLYSCIKKRRDTKASECKKLELSQSATNIATSRCARSNIYKPYKVINSMNTLKKALFCARNGMYPSVNKEWSDELPVYLKRCQWHYLISSCRIAMRMEVLKREDDRSQSQEYEDWLESTFI